MAEPSRPRTAVVTGATGFLGLNLVEQLTADGWQVTAVHRKGSRLEDLKKFDVALAKADLLDLAALTDAVPEGADAVFHTAADTTMWARHASRQMRTNIDGTRNAVTAAQRKGARRFVHTSTWNVYGQPDGPIDEASPKLGERSAINYDRTKFYAELIVLAAVPRGLEAVILNPSHILGRYDRHNWSRMIQLAARGKLPGIPPGHGTFCHAEAVAAAHIAAVDKGRPGENYLLGGVSASFVEIVRMIGEMAGAKVPRRAIPAWLFRLVARARNRWGNLTGREPDLTPQAAQIVLSHATIESDKAARELGYASPDLRTMLEDAHGWLKAEGLV